MNIACGERFSLLDLLDGLKNILNRKLNPVFVDARPGDVKHSMASMARAQSIMGFSPQVKFQEGLKKTIGWIVASCKH